MASRAHRLIAGVCLAAATLLAGCGGSDPEPEATPTAVAEATPVQPHIESPGNGDVVASTAALGDTRGAKIQVEGTAEPDAKVVIGSGCPQASCRRTVTAGNDGGFSGEVSASTTSADEAVTITVAYELSDSVASDRVIVTLGDESEASEEEFEDAEASPTPRPKRKRPRNPSSTPTPSLPEPTVPAPQPTAAPTTSGGGGGGSGSVVVIGDSLAQGIQPFLGGALPGWNVSVDARIGRPLAEGMRLFSSPKSGTVYAFSLFTNDDPKATRALSSAVADSVQRAGCAVWATIVRPPLNGVSYDAANQTLAQLKSTYGNRLQLVDWAAAVRANPSWLAGDGVHATPTGYRNRAALYADAIRRCN